MTRSFALMALTALVLAAVGGLASERRESSPIGSAIRLTASLLGLLILAVGCGSSSVGGGSGGSSSGGGALGGSSGRGGNAGGNTGTGGGGGPGGGAGGHAGTGGSTGGAGAFGGGGAGGGAGQGAGGSQGFDCTGVTLDGDCSAFPVGLVCILSGEAPIGCVCVPANGGPKWQCDNGAPCPNQPFGPSGGTCTTATITTITNFGGCKYPPATVCSCEAAGGGAAFSCNNVGCPAAPPTGSCAGSPAAGFSCDYEGTAISCDCGITDGGASRWRCNGKATPDCPASWPGGGVDCSTFQPGTVCSYPAGNVTGGPCTCASGGSGLTWHCGNG
jgi:hypothetical protein